MAEKYELWIAYYGDYNDLSDYQTSWAEYIGVQFSDTGNINGISGDVDRDLFTVDVLLDEENITEIQSNGTMTTDFNTELIYYTVQSGNTLGEIAAMYGTTAQQIADLNGITNINLIYPGERLNKINICNSI